MRDTDFRHDSLLALRRPPATLWKSVGGLLSAAIFLAACTTGATTTAGPPSTANPAGSEPVGSAGGGASIDATESDYKIDVTATSAAPGPVTFHITNTATQVHEFVVIKTDASADQLPEASGGLEVDEEASGLTVVDEVEDLAAGASADLAVTLEAGHYALICNIAGHYQLGMHTDFTVGP